MQIREGFSEGCRRRCFTGQAGRGSYLSTAVLIFGTDKAAGVQVTLEISNRVSNGSLPGEAAPQLEAFETNRNSL